VTRCTKTPSQAIQPNTRGRFRWAACQLDVLEDCLDYRTLNKALTSLPKTLDETYSRIIARIRDEHKAYAVRILQFLAFSNRPLSIEETVDVIAVDTEAEPHFDPSNRMPDPREISHYCSSLVVVVPTASGNMLQLAHFSVQEYLISDRLDSDTALYFQKWTASATIAQVCLAYLLQFEQELPPQEVQAKFPLAQYSACSWIDHAAVAERDDNHLRSLIERFYCFKEASYRVCYSLHRPDRRWMDFETIASSTPASPLYYAAFGNLPKTVEMLLDKGADVNAQGGDYGNALQAASSEGHEQVVKLLLNKGADVNAQGGDYDNALCAASSKGHEQVVGLLLKKGANVNTQGGYYGNALQAASSKGNEQVVKLLLNKGADINVQGGRYSNALQAASSEGHEQVVKLLLNKGADVNPQGGSYSNALCVASSRGHEQVVRLLVEKGANINAQGIGYSNALCAASSKGHEQVVKLLLNKGAEVNAADEEGWTPLHAASFGGHEELAKLLVEKGADAKAVDKNGWTPLHLASSRGLEELAKLLIDKGADVEAAANNGGTPLHLASFGGHEELAKLLVEKGADTKAVDKNGWTPLHSASFGGHEELAKLLVEKGADAKAVDKNGWTPLHSASSRGHEELSKLLIEKGADVEAAANDGGTPLHTSLLYGHVHVIRLLLDKDGETCRHDNLGRSLFFYAVRGGLEAFNLLRDRRMHINQTDCYGSTLLSVAVRYGHEELVNQLLAIPDIDCTLEDNFGRSALWWARKQNYVGIVERLLEYSKTRGLDLGVLEAETGEAAVFLAESRTCDVCLSTIQEYCYHCTDCNGGNFDICPECQELGAHCLNEVHVLLKAGN
jgi:ankyrin repeat protein